MAGPEVHHLFHHPIADHSFSADRKTLAVARDITVELYRKSGNDFILQDELKGHDKTVTGVDIAPTSGMIVTCSQGTHPFSSPGGGPVVFVVTQTRSQCLRMGTLANGLEADTCPSANQPCSDVRALVAF